MRMALIQGMENANKTRVRFGSCANGGFLEGAGLMPFAHSRLDARLWWNVNIVQYGRGTDSASIARTAKSGDALLPSLYGYTID